MSLEILKRSRRSAGRAARPTMRADLNLAVQYDKCEPVLPRSHETTATSTARTRGRIDAGLHEAILMLDIETVIDADLVPVNWPQDRFPKAAWHRIVAISVVEVALERDDGDGTEMYRLLSCRSGGEANWDEARLLRAFWTKFAAGRYRVVTWNGRAFDIPTLLQRSMRHGLAVPSWFQRGTRWDCYGHRYALSWHTDVMEVLSDFGATARLTLDEGAALVGAPGKMGEHGSDVAAMIAAGETRRVRDYCETDCINMYLVYLRWAHLTGRTNAAAHDAAVRELQAYLVTERGQRPHLGRFADAWRAIRESPFVVPSSRRVERNVVDPMSSTIA